MNDQQKSYRKDIARLMPSMEWMNGYPKTKAGLDGYIDCVCRIIQDQPTLEKSAIETAVWLIEEATLSFDRFPSAAELHEVYRKIYRPADQGPVPELAIKIWKEKKESDNL